MKTTTIRALDTLENAQQHLCTFTGEVDEVAELGKPGNPAHVVGLSVKAGVSGDTRLVRRVIRLSKGQVVDLPEAEAAELIGLGYAEEAEAEE